MLTSKAEFNFDRWRFERKNVTKYVCFSVALLIERTFLLIFILILIKVYLSHLAIINKLISEYLLIYSLFPYFFTFLFEFFIISFLIYLYFDVFNIKNFSI